MFIKSTFQIRIDQPIKYTNARPAVFVTNFGAYAAYAAYLRLVSGGEGYKKYSRNWTEAYCVEGLRKPVTYLTNFAKL